MRSQAEFRLTCLVADYLARCAPELTVSHFPAGEHRSATTGARLKRMGLRRGWPDFIAVLPGGRACGFELKADGGRQSDHQLAIQHAFEATGAAYYVVRSLDDLRSALCELRVVTREARAA